MIPSKIFSWLWIGLGSLGMVSCLHGPANPATAIPTTSSTPPPAQTNTPTLILPTATSRPTEPPTLTPFPWPTSEGTFDGARVTFINQAGFLITVGDKKVLIDALFETNMQNIDPPDEVLERIVNGEPPFDQIDLVFATHDHFDHFSVDLVRDHLRNNPAAVFISSPDAVRRIQRLGDEFDERLIAVNLQPGERSRLSVNGIELDCLYITHGHPSMQNIGVVITVGEYTFFHTGDMNIDSSVEYYISLEDFQEYGLHQIEIDLAILPAHIYSLEEGVTLIENGIQARYLSPMHYSYLYPPTSLEEDFSNIVVFTDVLEEWVVP
jgi:L-ascorbate metabolism protein UlaG (beta-lactamase superfamily)